MTDVYDSPFLDRDPQLDLDAIDTFFRIVTDGPKIKNPEPEPGVQVHRDQVPDKFNPSETFRNWIRYIQEMIIAGAVSACLLRDKRTGVESWWMVAAIPGAGVHPLFEIRDHDETHDRMHQMEPVKVDGITIPDGTEATVLLQVLPALEAYRLGEMSLVQKMLRVVLDDGDIEK
jgi:hypothetical protein